MASVKCVIVGDVGSGKSTLVRRFITRKKKSSSNRGMCDEIVAAQVFEKKMRCDKDVVNLTLVDTSGLPIFKQQRIIQYDNANVYLICFSFVRPASFAHISDWVDEIRHHSGTSAPIVVAGTHADLLTDQMRRQNEADTEELGEYTKAKVCAPCSGSAGINVDEVFETVLAEWKKSQAAALATDAYSAETACKSGDSGEYATIALSTKLLQPPESLVCRFVRDSGNGSTSAFEVTPAQEEATYFSLDPKNVINRVTEAPQSNESDTYGSFN